MFKDEQARKIADEISSIGTGCYVDGAHGVYSYEYFCEKMGIDACRLTDNQVEHSDEKYYDTEWYFEEWDEVVDVLNDALSKHHLTIYEDEQGIFIVDDDFYNELNEPFA